MSTWRAVHFVCLPFSVAPFFGLGTPLTCLGAGVLNHLLLGLEDLLSAWTCIAAPLKHLLCFGIVCSDRFRLLVDFSLVYRVSGSSMRVKDTRRKKGHVVDCGLAGFGAPHVASICSFGDPYRFLCVAASLSVLFSAGICRILQVFCESLLGEMVFGWISGFASRFSSANMC